jgi:hypothetical protein
LDEVTADLIVQLAEPIPLPSDTRLLAFHWANAEAPASEACADLHGRISPERRG